MKLKHSSIIILEIPYYNLIFFPSLPFLLFFIETDDTDIKIADFGFAKKTVDLLPTETACGTPG
jgi:serine/threonine protein kinase